MERARAAWLFSPRIDLAILLVPAIFIGDPRVRVSFDPLALAVASEAYVRATRFVIRGTRRRTPTIPST